MTKETTNQRIAFIDAAKGFLILLMLLGHIWNDGLVHDIIYTFHMPAFFVISGILLPVSLPEDSSFLKVIIKKARTLLIPYLFFEVFGICIHILLYGATLNIKGYLFEILSLHLYNGPLWFLLCMFLCQLLFLCVIYLHLPKAVTLSTLFFLIMILPKYPQYVSISTIVTGTFFLLLGFYCKDFWVKESPPRGLLLISCAVVLIASLNNVGMPDYQDGSRLLFIAGAISGTYSLLQFSKYVVCKPLCYCGQNSLIILGSHYPILRIAKQLLHIHEFSILSGIGFLFILLPLECLIIQFINRFIPFAAGKKATARKYIQT